MKCLTEAQAWRKIAEDAVALGALRPHGTPGSIASGLCWVVDSLNSEHGLIDLNTRLRMKERIYDEMRANRISPLYVLPTDEPRLRGDHNWEHPDFVEPRILLALFFALEAEDEEIEQLTVEPLK